MTVVPIAGLFPQVYLGAITGQNRDAQLSQYAKEMKFIGCKGLVLHGFPRGMVHSWDRLARIVQNEGLLALASWGLDGRKDNDGTDLTAVEKGALCGEILRRSNCAGGYLDAEGRWDADDGPADDMDERGAMDFGRALRAVCGPDPWLGDQPWPAIDSHGELRRSARPLADGGVFAGFPVDEFAASCVNGDRARQLYWANFIRQWGKDAYEKFSAWMERDWTRIRPVMTAAGLARTEAVTIQLYGHADTIDLVTCMLEWWVNRNTRVVGWAEPFASPVARRAMAATVKLVAGLAPGDSTQPRDIVRKFQTARGLTPDGLCGEKTCAALGV